MKYIIALLILMISQLTLSFLITNTRQTTTLKSLSMAGGRSKEEVGLSKQQLFRSIRDKLNKAAEQPGFFDVGEGLPDIELYCKSNKDGTQIGDCPFAQFIQLVLIKKGLRYTVKPTLASSKPDWLIEKHGGKLPVLVHKGTSIGDSLAIAEYIEKNFPFNSLTRLGAYSYQEVLEKTSNFFPSLKTLLLNKDESKDAELISKVDEQLNIIDEILRSTPGQYLGGIEQTLADLYLIPQLFHALVTLDHFKDVEILNIGGEPTRPALENYLNRFLNSEEFNDKKAYYNVDQVIYGWKLARSEA